MGTVPDALKPLVLKTREGADRRASVAKRRKVRLREGNCQVAEPSDPEMTTHCGLSHVRECGASPPPPHTPRVSPTQRVVRPLSSCPPPGSEQQCPCGGPPSGQPRGGSPAPPGAPGCPRGSGHRLHLPASRLSQSTSCGCSGSYIKLPLAVYFTYGNISFSAILSNHPTLSFSH